MHLVLEKPGILLWPMFAGLAFCALSAAQAVQPSSRKDLESASVSDLVATAQDIQIAIETMLIAPPQESVEENEWLSKAGKGGVVRLLYGREYATILFRPGGGARYSFYLEAQDESCEPDIHLDALTGPRSARQAPAFEEAGRGRTTSLPQPEYNISVGLSGGTFGLVLALGDVALESVPESDAAPDFITASQRPAWDACWAPIGAYASAIHTSDRERLLANADLSQAIHSARVPATFLVRSYCMRRHDVLVALRVLAHDDQSLVFSWRMLKEWRLSDASGIQADSCRALPPPAPWTTGMSVAQLLELLDSIRAVGGQRLLSVESDLHRQYKDVLPDDPAHGGLCRVLRGDQYRSIIGDLGGGAYFNFESCSNARNGAQLWLMDGNAMDGMFSATGSRGIVADLGRVSNSKLKSLLRDPTGQRLSGKIRKLWEFMMNLNSFEREGGAIGDSDLAAGRKLGADRGLPAREGHAYLLRYYDPGLRSNVAVLFAALEENETGFSLLWRRL